MKGLFLPYQQSKDFREFGFDEICLTHWWGKEILNEAYGGWMRNSNTKYVMAPTWEQAFNFFREKGFYISIKKVDNLRFLYYLHREEKEEVSEIVFSTWEEARLQSLIHLIQIYKTIKIPN